MFHIAMDISGNFHEGKGTTGITTSEDGEIILLTELKATNYSDIEEYWEQHAYFIEMMEPDHVTFEGYKLYNHKGKAASIQTHSELETPQMLGYLRMYCYRKAIPYNIQFASEVKTRWSEEVLVRLGILELKNGKYLYLGEPTNQHKRDSLKHALHWWRYKYNK